MASKDRLFSVRPLTNKEKGEIIWAARYSCRSFCLAVHRLGKIRTETSTMKPQVIVDLLKGLLGGEKGVTSLSFPKVYNIRRTVMNIVIASQTGRQPGTRRWLEDLDFVNEDDSVETLERIWLDDNPLPPPRVFGRERREPYQLDLFEVLEPEEDEQLTA